MGHHSLVSVIIPAYNSSPYICDAVDSVLSQTYSNLEVIVVNDGSTDATLQVLEKYGNRIIVIDQLNQGVAHARNAGIKAAQGEFVTFLDSDDYWFQQKVELQVKYLQQHPEMGAVYADWGRWFPIANEFPDPLTLAPKNVNLEIDLDQSGDLYEKLIFDFIIHTITIMIKKSVLNDIGYFDTRLKMGEDYDLWLRLSRVTKIDKLSTPLALYRANSDSITNNPPLDINYSYVVLLDAIRTYDYLKPDGSYLSKNMVQQRLADLCLDFAYQHYRYGNLYKAYEATLLGAKHRVSVAVFKSFVKILLKAIFPLLSPRT